MFSASTLKLMAAAAGGAALGGMLGWRKANSENMDTEDRLGFVSSSIVAGTASGLTLGLLGGKRLAGYGKAGLTGLNYARKAVMWNPIKDKLISSGLRKNFGYSSIPKVARGPLFALAMLGVGIGVTAYTSRSNPQPTAYASRDEYGDTAYSQQTPIKDRLGLLGSAGETVFGLHNRRHG